MLLTRYMIELPLKLVSQMKGHCQRFVAAGVTFIGGEQRWFLFFRRTNKNNYFCFVFVQLEKVPGHPALCLTDNRVTDENCLPRTVIYTLSVSCCVKPATFPPYHRADSVKASSNSYPLSLKERPASL